MAKFVETITNIFKIEELKKRIIYTLLLVLVYRLGCYILLPGLDPEVLKGGISGTQEGLVGLLNMFSGGAFGNASIFALGVMPYISASIVVQLLGMFVPSFRKMQMEGESGRRKMNQITRYLTIAVQPRVHRHPDGRNDVRHVARRAHHRPWYRQRYFPHHHDRYRRPSPVRAGR